MSVKLPKRLSSKKKKPPKDNAQAEVLNKLGLEAFWTTPLDPASMLDISTWTLENQAPIEPKDLPNAFLQRLWLLSPEARSPCCKPLHDVLNNANKSPEEMVNGFGGESQCAVNPLDLVTAVFMSANTFLQQEMTGHMLQCQFAVPLVLPNIDPQEPSRFLLWPLRGAVSQWRSHFPDNNRKVQEGDLASTYMPVVSCVKLGDSCVSKSQVLNNIISGLRAPCDTFLHRGMDGGRLPRRLSNGLVEIGWYLPTGDSASDIFPVPLVISNLRGDASTHEKCLSLLCQASSAVVVFCGNLREKDKQLLASCKSMASKLILIDVSEAEKNENRVVGFVGPTVEEYMALPRGSVLQGKDLSEEELANRLCDTLKDLLPDGLKLVTLEAATKLAEELGLNVDEGAVCKKAMATVEEALKGLDEGSAQFREKQLPLQGHLWSKLAEIEKEESKQRKEGKEIDPQLQKEKKDILVDLSSYKMTPAMKIFTDALFSRDKVERTYFLSWMKLKLRLKQIEKGNRPQNLFTNLQTERKDGMPEHYDKLQNGANGYLGDSDSFSTDSTFEEENTEEQPEKAELQLSEQFEIGQELEHLESTHDPVREQQLYVTSNENEIQGIQQISDPVFEDQNRDLEFRENGTLSCQWKQVNEPELTQLDELELTQLDEPELTQLDELELTQVDEPEQTQVDEPEQTHLDEPERTQLDEPERIQLDEPDLTQVDEPEQTHLDEPERTQLDEPERTQLDEPERTQLDEPDLTHLDEPDLTHLDEPERTQLDEPDLTHLDEPERTHLDEPEMTQLDEPEMRLTLRDLTSSANQQMCLDVSFEHPVASCLQSLETEPSWLGLEHFLREMGLIFELTHTSPGSGSHNVLRLPSLATDLLLYGIPLELMDGDASNIPIHWLGCVFAELKRRLPQEQCRTRVLTNLGAHHGRNAEVLSALFGVKFPEGRQRSTRGLYMVALCLPDNLRKDMECDFLLLIDVEGLCSMSLDNNRNTLIKDNEMATVATGLSDVLMQNIASHAGSEFETDFTVIVNALLRIKECGSMPICQLLAQDEGINSLLQALQLRRVSDMLQTETGDRGTDKHDAKTTSCITYLKGPWYNMSLSEPIDTQYSKAVLQLKQNLFGALKKCAAESEATGLPEFMSCLCAVWEAVKSESFSIGLENTDIALAFSLLCTELSQWEDGFLEHMESWLKGATKKIIATKAKALDAVIQNGLLSELKDEAKEEVKTEVDKLRSKVEAYLMKDKLLKTNTIRPLFMNNMDDLQDRVTEETIQRLGTVNESHCSSTQLEKFETLLEKEQESRLLALVENSKSTKALLQDTELEEEFEGALSKTLSNFDFRPSETDDITARVTAILKENLISCGLQKHMKKLEVIGQNQTSSFKVYDEHFGYRSRLKHMFDDNNRLQRLEAHQVAFNIIEEYKQFVADKSSLPADFSDSYITKMLKNVEKALKEKPMEIKTAFEVDLKVYLCSAACQDFQKLHDRYAKDSELLTSITATKSTYLAEFIYQFRKRDQCQRMAQAFTSMVVKPTMLDYIYRPLGMRIVKEIQGKAQQYHSPRAFHQSLLEELLEEDRFESFLEYLLSYEDFRVRKIQETVVAHLSESTNLDNWRQQRLGEIVGKIAAAVSQTAEGTNGVLSDTKPLLERVCLILEKDADVDVTRASLDGPFFSITTEWDRFVTCLMELLAAMRLVLAQEFTQNVEITKLLQCLPVQPGDSLFNRVRGCDQQCPLCRAPCELEEMEHEVHRALLHRPKGMLPHDPFSLSCPESMTEGNPGMSKDTHDMPVAWVGLHSLYSDWSISAEDPDSQMPGAYWRYVLARFNERFAKEYKQEPANIPEEWKKITKEEALYSVKKAFFNGQC
ncbi:interferon-induced very large GTPase 1 [Sebastes fasciatus]|uniref:interferon-induced very large GTPase 1 n=1 Tax=Sebastes fasciatus TaxID=394691 RepID=UPI003D9F528A